MYECNCNIHQYHWVSAFGMCRSSNRGLYSTDLYIENVWILKDFFIHHPYAYILSQNLDMVCDILFNTLPSLVLMREITLGCFPARPICLRILISFKSRAFSSSDAEAGKGYQMLTSEISIYPSLSNILHFSYFYMDLFDKKSWNCK